MFAVASPTMAPMQDSLPATPTNTASGTIITSSASANTKGAYAQLIASTDFDVWGITVLISGTTTAATVRNYLIDIATGGAGSEVVVAANLPGNSVQDTRQGPPCYFLPILIPKGTRIAARCQDQVGSRTASVTLFCHGGPSAPPWPIFQGCLTIGAATASSSGALVTGGNKVYSAWANIGSTLPRDIKAYFPMTQNGANTALNIAAYQVQYGYSSTPISEHMFFTGTFEGMLSPYPSIPVFARIPAGTQMQMRAMCHAAGQSLQHVLLGFY